MSEQKNPTPKKKSLSSILGIIIPLIGGGCIGLFGGMWLGSLADGNDRLFFIYLTLMIVGLLLGFLVQIIIHEGGHMIFGLLSGYEFVSFNVMGLIWQKDDQGKLRVGRMQIAGAGGQCLMAPPAYNGGDFPFTLYNLGGVLANLISAAVFGLLAWLVPVAWVKILLVMLVAVGLISAVTNGLPIPVAAIQNDGKNLLCIRRDATARRAFWVQMCIGAELTRGVRIKDMPDDWFAPMPEDRMDNPIVSAIAVMNTSRLMDKLDFAGAEREIRRLLAREKGILGLYRMTMSCDGAVCELVAGRPGSLTEALSTKENQQLMKAMKTHPAILRTQYALALLQDKDAAKAEKLLAEFDKAAKNHPNPQEIVGERELIAAVQAAAKENAS